MPSHPVKFFSSQHTGLGSMPVAAGSLISVLDACLINGFNLQTLTSLAIVDNELIGGKNAHGYAVDQVIVVAGANEAVLNTEWRIFEVSTNGFKASAAGMANVTGTGTITAKVAPAGWSKPFSGTNLAAYQSVSLGSTGCLLRVDDTNTLSTRVEGNAAMSDIDTGVNPFPLPSMVVDGQRGAFWRKAGNAGIGWMVIATDKAFYFFNQLRSDHAYYSVKFFGDFYSERLADSYACALQGDYWSDYDPAHSWSQIGYSRFNQVTPSRIWVPCAFNQIGTCVELVTGHVGEHRSGGGDSFVPYPSGASNGVVLLPVTARELTSKTYRCLAWPGVYATPQSSPLAHGNVLRGVGPDGRDFVAIAANMQGDGRLFIDLTGPW